jgi:hypothetical protein
MVMVMGILASDHMLVIYLPGGRQNHKVAHWDTNGQLQAVAYLQLVAVSVIIVMEVLLLLLLLLLMMMMMMMMMLCRSYLSRSQPMATLLVAATGDLVAVIHRHIDMPYGAVCNPSYDAGAWVRGSCILTTCVGIAGAF